MHVMELSEEGQVFPDFQSVMNHMQQIASCGGTRTGKQLRRDPHVAQGSNRVTMICMTPSCARRKSVIEQTRWTTAASIKERDVLSEDGMRIPCDVFR